MVIQNLYETGSSSIISVGYTDVATGKSRTNLYAGLLYSGYASGAMSTDPILSGTGVLSNVAFYSNNIYTESTPNNATYIRNFDLDFDLPQTIEGQTIVQIPLGYSSTATGYGWVDIDIKKITGGTATSIISGSSCGHVISSGTSGAAVLSWMADMPRTSFKTGDKLRLSLFARGGGPGGISQFIAHDPMGRTWAYGDTTKLIVQVPFKIDI